MTWLYMTWLPVQTITTSVNWVETEPVQGNLFRLINSSNSQNTSQLRLRIAQAFREDGKLNIFDIRKILYKFENEIFLFIKPPGLVDRRIAVKRDDLLTDDWTVQIEVLAASEENDDFTLSAQCDRTCTIGQPLYLKSNSTVDLAQADALATSRLCGLAISNANQYESVDYKYDDVIQLSNWTSVTDTQFLSVGETYYLSPTTAGKLTTIAPTLSGQLVVKVGTAFNSTALNLEIEPPILL